MTYQFSNTPKKPRRNAPSNAYTAGVSTDHKGPYAVESQRGFLPPREADQEFDHARVEDGFLAGGELQQQVAQGGGCHYQHLIGRTVQDLEGNRCTALHL